MPVARKHQGTELVTGAAGFIGSHLVDRLIKSGASVVGLDNLSRGNLAHLSAALTSPQFELIKLDLTRSDDLERELGQRPIRRVWHMVANSDIRAGVADPKVDLNDTFLTTFNLLQAMRTYEIKQLAFASSSAVYGQLDAVLAEDTGPLFPISNYGAMKLACEGMISAAIESHLEQAWIFRFPNVIGPRATHGVILDLLKKLASNPPYLEVLGDGKQMKPYLHVSELVDAMIHIADNARESMNCFNIGPNDEGATVLQIAESVRASAGPDKPIRFTGGSKGWVGDVPRFSYSVDKLGKLGWTPKLTSIQAVERAVVEIHRELNQSVPESSGTQLTLQ